MVLFIYLITLETCSKADQNIYKKLLKKFNPHVTRRAV